MKKKPASPSFFRSLLNWEPKENFPPKSKAVAVFDEKNQVCLLCKRVEKNRTVYFWAFSKDGLDFTKDQKLYASRSEALMGRKKANFGRYKSLIEKYCPFPEKGKLAIQSVIQDFPKPKETLIIYHRQKLGNYLIGSLIMKGVDCLWVNPEPIWETAKFWPRRRLSYLGFARKKDRFLSYWYLNRQLWLLAYPENKLSKFIHLKTLSPKLARANINPLIKPLPSHSWEAFNTFNPAAVYEAGKVHLLYRAQGYDYVSVLGYASSRDGLHLEERLDYPVYDTRSFGKKIKKPTEATFAYFSGGGFGGSEDPRLTRIGQKIYMTYVDFDGCSPPRIALTSIKLEDFLNHRWLWQKPVLISPPGVVDKSACLLPEKIKGKYVIFHRIYPNILIDFVDDLNFEEGEYLQGQYLIAPRPHMWDSRKIGAGAPPLKTKEGWLLIYQAVDERNPGQYQIGAMILELNDPTKVLYRCNQPILSPTQIYENAGFKAGVVYPCGAVIIKDTLFVYYGSADSYVCVATANLKNFLNQLKSSLTATLEPVKIKIEL